MRLLRYLQIAFTAKKWCFLFPRKESCYSPMSVTSLATVLASPCFRAGAGKSARLPAQLIAVEPVQRPYADVLRISSVNAHLEPCPFSPAIANLQGARKQTLPGEKERFSLRFNTRGAQSPHPPGETPIAVGHPGVRSPPLLLAQVFGPPQQSKHRVRECVFWRFLF